MDALLTIEGDDAPLSADIGDFIEIPEGMNWECQLCGSCCGNVFSKNWIDISLSEYVGDPVEGFCKYLDRREDGHKVCTRYETRPNICRGYPFVIKKRGDHYILTVHSRCKGIGKGGLLNMKERLLSTLSLVEDDLDMDFMVDWSSAKNNNYLLYKIK